MFARRDYIRDYMMIPPGTGEPDVANMIVEIPKGRRTKFEVDKATGLIKMDRYLYSSTMYPDFYNARIHNRPVPDVIGDGEWLEKDFIAIVQKRGAAIIEARGLSSAASAANAIVETVRCLTNPTPPEDWFSVAVCSSGAYDIAKVLIFSYPIRSDGKSWEIVPGLPLNDFSRSKIIATENELKEEKSLVSELL